MLGVRAPGVGGEILFNEETRELKPGTTLVLYTDGLIERRPKDDGDYYTRDESRELLREAVAQVGRRDVEAIANAAYEAVPGDIDDDVAIVVVRTSPEDLPVEERTFPAEPIMVSEARRLAAETFAAWGMLDEQSELACLLVSEVVTNVVLHATNTRRARRRELVLDGRRRRCSTDGGFERPAGRRPGAARARDQGVHAPARRGAEADLGRGLRLRPAAARASAAPARPTRAAAASTSSTSSPPAGVPARPRTARPSGSSCPSTGARSHA